MVSSSVVSVSFYGLQFYILFRHKDVYVHKVVSKTTTEASQYCKDNSSATECLTLGQYLFFPG